MSNFGWTGIDQLVEITNKKSLFIYPPEKMRNIQKTAATAGAQERDDKGRWVGSIDRGHVSSPGAKYTESFAHLQTDKQLLSSHREVSIYLANALKVKPKTSQGIQRQKHAVAAHMRSLTVLRDEIHRRKLILKSRSLVSRILAAL